MISPCDAEGLWMKAKVYINRSFAAREQGDFEQAALWAANALELLGKAALAKVSPLLVADPQDDGRSLLIAAGVSSDTARFKSVPAKAVFSRCHRAFRPFSKEEAELIAKQRNEELHSAGSPFTGLDQDAWWDRYWSQAILLIHAQDMTLADIVGTHREEVIEGHLARNSENVVRRVDMMMSRASERWQAASDSKDTQRRGARLVRMTNYIAEHSAAQKCPVCRASGYLFGDEILSSEVEWDYEGGGGHELLVVAADGFECNQCALELYGSEYLAEAGLPGEFDSEREYVPMYDDYGND
jgi:hypothetical protein